MYLEYGYSKALPFHRKTWFVVALAATSIVIIITVVAVLCVQSKTYKYKGRWRTSRFDKAVFYLMKLAISVETFLFVLGL